VRDNAPWLADLACQYIDSLQEASAYPFIGHAIGDLLEKISEPLTESNRCDIERFFCCIEVMLRDGDSNVKDLVYLEVADVLKDNVVLRPFFGALLLAEVIIAESRRAAGT
jgi:hypothetical protein